MVPHLQLEEIDLHWSWKSWGWCCRGSETVKTWWLGVKLNGVTRIWKTKSLPARSLRHCGSSTSPPPFISARVSPAASCFVSLSISLPNTTKVALSFPSSTNNSTRYLITPIMFGLIQRVQRREVPNLSSFVLQPVQETKDHPFCCMTSTTRPWINGSLKSWT